jgi:iron(III) transport system permease protein
MRARRAIPGLRGPELTGIGGLLALIAFPLAFLLRESLLWDGSVSLEAYRRAFSDAGNYAALGRTLRVGLLATAGSCSIGALLAWTCRRSDAGGRGLLDSWALFPFMVPPFIGAFAWGQILGPVGYANQALSLLAGKEVRFFNLYSEAGIVLVLAIHLYPMAYLGMAKALDQMDGALEEAARVSGAASGRIALDVTMPILAPSFANSVLLVFVAAISNFGVVATLGFSKGYYVLSTRIYDAVMNASMANHFAIASALSVILASVAGICLLAANLALGRRRLAVVGGRAMPAQTVRLGRWRGPATAAAWIFVASTAIFPLAALSLTAVTKAYGLPPGPSNLSLKNIEAVLLGMPTVGRSIANSLFLSLASASAAVVFAGLLAYLASKSGPAAKSALEAAATLPYAMPGTVLALGMILAYNSPRLGLRLYDSIWIILLAYVARYFIFPMREISSSLSRVSGDLEEAARVCGATQWRRLRDIVVPSLKPGIISGWFLVLIPTMHELTVSILLWSVGNETLGTTVYALQESGKIQATAALALLTIALAATIRRIAGSLDGKPARPRVGGSRGGAHGVR